MTIKKTKYVMIIIRTILLTVMLSCVSNVFYASAESMYGDPIKEQQSAAEKADELLSENSAQNILYRVTLALKENFFGYLKSFALILFITFMLGIINTVCGEGAPMYAGHICLCSFSFSVMATMCENVYGLMNSLNGFMLSMLPVMTSLYTSSVGAVTAGMSYSSTVFMLNLCSTLFSAVLIPCTKCIIVFSAVSLISRSFDFSGFCSGIRSIVVWLFGIVMCVMSAVIYFQSVISVAKDGLASRTLRYAASSLIPVIGNVVSESARTVSESLKLVRSVSGTAAVFAIVGIIASPIAALVVCRLFMLLCASLARLLGCTRAAAFYGDLCGTVNMLLASVIGTVLVFILILGIYAKASLQL